MEELVKYIIEQIVSNKDAVKVELKEDTSAFVLHIWVDKSDIGKVIGRQGRTATAIRTAIQSLANVDKRKRIVIKFNEA